MDKQELKKQIEAKQAIWQRKARLERLATSSAIRYVVNLYELDPQGHHRAVKAYKARHWLVVYEHVFSPSSPPDDAAVVEIIDLEKNPEHPNRNLAVEVIELDTPPFIYRAFLKLSHETIAALYDQEIRVPWIVYLGMLGYNNTVLAEMSVRDERYDSDYAYILRHPYVMTKAALAAVLDRYAGQNTGLLLGIVYEGDTEVFRGPLPECLQRMTTDAHRTWSYELLAHDAEYRDIGDVL
jgi:hypothetical protein